MPCRKRPWLNLKNERERDKSKYPLMTQRSRPTCDRSESPFVCLEKDQQRGERD